MPVSSGHWPLRNGYSIWDHDSLSLLGSFLWVVAFTVQVLAVWLSPSTVQPGVELFAGYTKPKLRIGDEVACYLVWAPVSF